MSQAPQLPVTNPTVAAAAAEEEQLPPHSDNVDEELRRIQLALEVVFSPQQPQQTATAVSSGDSAAWWQRRQLADRYLTSFQSTAVSWMVCDRLLLMQDNEQDATQQTQRWFFAAQTLHTKCRRSGDVSQLPSSSLISLRDSLVQHLTRHAASTTTAMVVTRLALAVAALSVQMSWTTIVTDLMETLKTNNNPTIVMEVLRVLPEECASDRLILGDENIRYYMRDHLVTHSPMVLQFCQSCLQQSQVNPNLTYGTLHSWIRYVPVPPTVICEAHILESTVHALTQQQQDDDLFEVVVDLLVEILRMYPSHHGQNERLVQTLIPLVLNLKTTFFDPALLQQEQEEHEDLLRGYCRIVTEMGESYMSLILSQQHYQEAFPLVEWVLACSTIVEKDIANMTLHFWYRFVMDLESKIEPYELRQTIIDAYTPLLLKLLDICTTHLMQYPPGENLDQLSPDRIDDIHRDRYHVAETVDDCCRLLGGDVVLRRVGHLFREECHRVVSLPHHHQQQWQGMEACLYCIQSIHRYIPNDEAEYLPFCMSIIPQLPPNISPLRFTATLTVGKYASWLAHPPNQQHMQPLMPYLAHGLSMPKCATAAAVAIKELCEYSNSQVALGEPVLQLYQGIVSAQEQQGEIEGVVGPVVLELRDELEILEGVCKAVSKQFADTSAPSPSTSSHPEMASSYLNRIVRPIGVRLTKCVSQPTINVRHVIAEVERLTVLVRFLKVPPITENATHPTVEIITSSWSLLDAATKRCSQDTMLAEKICRFHKHALRGCGPVVYAPMLEALITQLVTSFEISHQSPYLYCASICITEFGRDAAYVPRLLDMIMAISTSAFQLLKNLQDLTTHPDVVEELFYLMGRVISYMPEPLVANVALLRSLFQCASVGMQMDHRDANRGTLNFLETTVSYGLTLRSNGLVTTAQEECKAALESTITSEGQAVVTNLCRTLMGDLPAYSIDSGSGSIAGILYKLDILCPELLRQWMITALAVGAPERAKGDFLGSFGGGLTSDEFNLAVRAFVSACDRHRKLQQGGST